MEIHLTGLLPESLLVDLPEIDAQHEEIFHRIESLKAACFETAYVPVEDLRALIDYCARHFATEERIADEVGLEFADHTKIHRDTLRLMHRALSEVANGTQDAHSFLRYSEYWFERHIHEDDRIFLDVFHSEQLKSPCGRQAAVASRFGTPGLEHLTANGTPELRLRG
ncbi:MAG TPA: hemerythrin domain-containing protein [Accumulibacter sp.]|jgi:hemerythrin-like metal-binding protein|nr:hemerythrin domain-containing protein [Accumulibacter sp.]HQC81659.1 hemerythrin domain-containing protein [Accumulibacter sp.]